MASKYRKITISISNDELNAMEDFIVVDFQSDKKAQEKCRRQTLSIWNRLVKEWDKSTSEK